MGITRKIFSTILAVEIVLQFFGVGFLSAPEKASASLTPTHYVNASSGADSNGCGYDQQHACASIQYFINSGATVQSGSVVSVSGGTYSQPTASTSGYNYLYVSTRVSNVTFYTESTVTIRGATTDRSVYFAANVTGVTFEGPFVFDGGNDSGADDTGFMIANTNVTNISFNHCIFQSSNIVTGFSGNTGDSIIFNYCQFTAQSNASGSTHLINQSTTTSYTFNNCDFNIGGVTPFVYFIYSNGAGVTQPIIFHGGTLEITTTGAAFNMNSNASLTIEDTTNVDIHNAVDNYITAISFPGTNSGAISIKNNQNISYDTFDTKHYLLSVAGGAHTIEISGNSFLLPSTNNNTATVQGTRILDLTNQANVQIIDNTFESRTTWENEHIYFTSTGTSGGNLFIHGNTHYTRSLGGYIVRVGTESSSVNSDNKFDGAIIENNKIYGPGYFGVTGAATAGLHSYLLGFSKKIHFRNNYVNGGGYGVVIKGDGTNNTVVDYDYVGGVYGNIFVNNPICGVLIKGALNVPIYNNTFYLSSGKTMSSSGGFVTIIPNYVSDTMSNFRHSSGITVKNNIFYGQPTANQYALNFNDYTPQDVNFGQSMTGFISSNNLFYNFGSTPIRYPKVDSGSNSMQSISLADWKLVNSNYDQNSFIADPKYNDTIFLLEDTPGDINSLALDADSPAINAGAALPANADYTGAVDYKDFHGTDIPLYSKPTIGAIEFNAGNVTISTSKQVSSAVNESGYYTAKPTITLTTNNNVTNNDGAIIKYKLQSSDQQYSTYTAPITLDDGTYNLYYYSEDTLGNVEEVNGPFQFKVDTQAPVLAKTADISYTNVTQPTLNLTSDGAWPISYSGCASSSNALTSGANSITLNALAEGAHTCVITAQDIAGNQTSLTYSFTIDTTAPTLTIASPNDGASTNGSSIALLGSALDLNPGTTLTVNGVSVLNPSNFSVSGTLSSGANTFVFVATDAAGNTTTKTITVTRRSMAANDGLGGGISTTSTPSIASVSPAETLAAPATASQTIPSLELFNSSDNSSTTASNGTNTITTQTPTLRGKTSPYATVILEFHSDPFTAQVLADEDGNWEYTPTTQLSYGEHTVKITIKAKDTNQTIAEGTYNLNIVEKTEAKAKETESNKENSYLLWIILGVVVAGGVLILFRNKRK